jgi:hypothetical protein
VVAAARPVTVNVLLEVVPMEAPFSKTVKPVMVQPAGAEGAVQVNVTLLCVIAEDVRPVGALGLTVQPPPLPLHGPRLVQSAGVAGGVQSGEAWISGWMALQLFGTPFKGKETIWPTLTDMPTCQGGAQVCADASHDIPKHIVATTTKTNGIRLFIEDLLNCNDSVHQDGNTSNKVAETPPLEPQPSKEETDADRRDSAGPARVFGTRAEISQPDEKVTGSRVTRFTRNPICNPVTP